MRALNLLRRLVAGAAFSALVASPLTAALPARAETPGSVFHVDCTGRKDGTGTPMHPWNSLGRVTSHGAFHPGDQVLIRRGTSCRGRIAPSGSGRTGHPVTLGAYGAGAKPVLVGGGTQSGTAVVTLADVHDWVVQDLRITNTTGKRSTPAYRAGVRLVNTGVGRLPGLVVQRLAVDHVASNMANGTENSRDWGGIVAVTYGTGDRDGFDRLEIRNNVLSSVGREGIMVSNRGYPRSGDLRVRVTGNIINAARGDSIVVNGSKYARVDHNVSANGADEWPCPLCGPITPATANAAIWTASSFRTRIDHNEVYGERWLGGDGEAFDLDASARDSLVEFNYAHDNKGGAVLFCGSTNATVRFNIFENNERSTFAYIGNMPATGTRIYNNTVYQSRKTDAGTVRYFNGRGGSRTYFYNNLIYNYGRAYYLWVAKPSSARNTFRGRHKPGEPHGRGWSRADPGLRRPGSGGIGFDTLSGYRLRLGHRVQQGVAIPKSVTRDFFGKKIDPKHPPRGAAG